MARNSKTQLAGKIGEGLVVAELGRRGIVATAFADNVPDIDLFAYKDGISQHLQVKTWRTGAVSFNATRFLRIDIHGDVQTVSGLDETLDGDLVYVFVLLGEKLGFDRFFLRTQSSPQAIVSKGYLAFLAKHGGVRPRNAQTTHNAVFLNDLLPFEDNSQLIEERFHA